MPLFHRSNRAQSDRHERVYAAFEIARTAVDFAAAACFVVGSVLFLWKSLETLAIWFFIVGSVFFFAKPSLKLAREIRLLSLGDVEDVAERAEQ